MRRVGSIYIMLVFTISFLQACVQKESGIKRPKDPWAFRSVLDKKPRMLTLALDSSCYAAYDLAHCTLYKVWKGGVDLQGAAFTDKKNVQPTSWGTSYSDSLEKTWVAEINGKKDSIRLVSKGYRFHNNQVWLKHALILSSGDTIQIEEHPEYIQNEKGQPGFERVFTISNVPAGVTISLTSGKNKFSLQTDHASRLVKWFHPLRPQFPTASLGEYDHRGRYWMEKSDCFTCHELYRHTVGPSFQDVALKYKDLESVQSLVHKVKAGGSGVWGPSAMNAHPQLAEHEIRTMIDYILTLRPSDHQVAGTSAPPKKEQKNVQPGFGAPLEGVHPSFDVQTIRPHHFKPKVGGLAFLPNGHLLVTTWDSIGAVYRLSGVKTADTSKIKIKRIASGLAEPLGIEVVDGEIYVLQKHELTKLSDTNGDEVMDVYETVCNSWGVTADFHEFAFGLVYKDGYFYVTLSMAMRLMSNERQHPDRGKTIRISKDGSYEWINYGLRTPNGIGIGVDNELFVTDNQGEWLPANKLIHIRKGEYHGMRWGHLDTIAEPPAMAMPAIWLPEDEIGNSPSEPVLIREGLYKGQMLHGDVTHGGIKRDFLEKINGAYQGAVFRFSQGLEAGVNRMRWGPDGALYIGGVGMVGGWSWKEKQYGLQRMTYNGKPTFEMLAVHARPKGFEIEFTVPLAKGSRINPSRFLLQQWWYLPTAGYGGPKKDLQQLKVTGATVSADRKRIFLEIPGLKKQHVVYFLLPVDLKSEKGQSLWSGEAWYTLNQIPDREM